MKCYVIAEPKNCPFRKDEWCQLFPWDYGGRTDCPSETKFQDYCPLTDFGENHD